MRSRSIISHARSISRIRDAAHHASPSCSASCRDANRRHRRLRTSSCCLTRTGAPSPAELPKRSLLIRRRRLSRRSKKPRHRAEQQGAALYPKPRARRAGGLCLPRLMRHPRRRRRATQRRGPVSAPVTPRTRGASTLRNRVPCGVAHERHIHRHDRVGREHVGTA